MPNPHECQLGISVHENGFSCTRPVNKFVDAGAGLIWAYFCSRLHRTILALPIPQLNWRSLEPDCTGPRALLTRTWFAITIWAESEPLLKMRSKRFFEFKNDILVQQFSFIFDNVIFRNVEQLPITLGG
jgi:hypothetical protein